MVGDPLTAYACTTLVDSKNITIHASVEPQSRLLLDTAYPGGCLVSNTYLIKKQFPFVLFWKTAQVNKL